MSPTTPWTLNNGRMYGWGPPPPENCADICRIKGIGTPPPGNGTKVEGRGGDLLISRGKVYLEIVYLGKLKTDFWTTLYLKTFLTSK